jgi:hypothetical protein
MIGKREEGERGYNFIAQNVTVMDGNPGLLRWIRLKTSSSPAQSRLELEDAADSGSLRQQSKGRREHGRCGSRLAHTDARENGEETEARLGWPKTERERGGSRPVWSGPVGHRLHR